MPEIRDYYAHMKELDLVQLHARRNELLQGKAPGEFKHLEDEALAELLAITRELRKRASFAPKKTGSKRKAKTEEESLDALI